MSGDGTGENPSTVLPAGPVQERDRIGALDAVRGFALLGILFVNMRFFAMRKPSRVIRGSGPWL